MKRLLLVLALVLWAPALWAQTAKTTLLKNTTPSPSLLGNIIQSYGSLPDINVWTGANSFSGAVTFSGPILSGQATPTLVLAGGTCAGTVITGGLVGTVTLTAACAATDTMTLSALPTATHSYVCTAQNRTVPATLINETSSTATTAVFTFAGTTTGATDVLQYSCQGF